MAKRSSSKPYPKSLSSLLLTTLAVLTPAFARADSPEERIAAAGALFGAQKYAEAALKLDDFLASYPKHPKTGVVAYTLGRCRSELKQYSLAVPAYEKAVSFGVGAILPQAQLGLGESALLSKQYAKAIPALEAATKMTLKPEQEPIVWFWLAQSNFQLQKYAPAETAYSKVYRSFPDSEIADSACFGAALSAFKQKKTDVAKEDFKTLLKTYPKSQSALVSGLYVAQIDLEAKRYSEAKPEFESLLKFIASNPKTEKLQADAEDGLIQTLLALKEYGAASGRLENALLRLSSTDPQYFRANLSLGHCRYHIKEFDTAIVSYLEAAKSSETEVAKEGTYWAGASFLAYKKLPDSASQFLKFVRKYPKDELAPKAQLRAANALYDLNQNDQAKAAYQVLIDNYPHADETKEAQIALKELRGERLAGSLSAARSKVLSKNYPEALIELNSLLRSKPEDSISAEAQYLLGTIYEAQSKPEEAVSAYLEALKLKPDALRNAGIQQSLAWLYLDLKQPANSEKAANNALTLNLKPENEIQVRLALTQSYLDQERWEPALEASKTLLEKKPDPETTATVLSLQAEIYEKQKRPDDALAIYERLAEEFPKNERTALALLKIGDERAKSDKFEEAEKRYLRLRADFPNSNPAKEMSYGLAGVSYRLGKFSDAATEYDRTANEKTLSSLAPESLYWAGVSWDKAGKKDLAIQRLSKLIETYPKDEHAANAKIRLAALKAVK